MYKYRETQFGNFLNLVTGSVYYSLSEVQSILNAKTSSSIHAFELSEIKKKIESQGIQSIKLPVCEIQFPLRQNGTLFDTLYSSMDWCEVISSKDLTLLIENDDIKAVVNHNSDLPFEEVNWGTLQERKTKKIYRSIEQLWANVNGYPSAELTSGKFNPTSMSTITRKADTFAKANEHFIIKQIPFEQIDHMDSNIRRHPGNNINKFINNPLFEKLLNYFALNKGQTTKDKPNFSENTNLKPSRQMLRNAIRKSFPDKDLNFEPIELTNEDVEAFDKKFYRLEIKFRSQAKEEVLEANEEMFTAYLQSDQYRLVINKIRHFANFELNDSYSIHSIRNKILSLTNLD